MPVPVHAPHHAKEHGLEFDYGSLTPSAARFLKEQARKIVRTSANSVIQIGRDLVAAKHYLNHGAFLRWVEGEVGMRARTAQAYMQVANWVSGKSATVAHLPPSVLYLLSAASTPEQYVGDILRRIEAGENVALTVVRDELKALRRQKNGAHTDNRCSDGDAGESGPTAGAGPLMEAVAILAHILPESEFSRIREIMTDGSVLGDPALARNIAAAFSSFATPAGADDASCRDMRRVDVY